MANKCVKYNRETGRALGHLLANTNGVRGHVTILFTHDYWYDLSDEQQKEVFDALLALHGAEWKIDEILPRTPGQRSARFKSASLGLIRDLLIGVLRGLGVEHPFDQTRDPEVDCFHSEMNDDVAEKTLMVGTKYTFLPCCGYRTKELKFTPDDGTYVGVPK